MTENDFRNNWGKPMGAAVPLIVILFTVLSIVLSAADDLGLTPQQRSAWILALFGLPGLLSVILVIKFKQPILLTGNLFVIIFISSLGSEASFPELVGAAMISGVVVAFVALLGFTEILTRWIPRPIVLGLLAGVVLPFLTNMFNLFEESPLIVGSTFIVYLLSRRFFGKRIPPIFPALVAGLFVAGISGQFGRMDTGFSLPIPTITIPAFSLQTIITATPLIVVFIILQANLPSIVYLESLGYSIREMTVYMISGIGTILGSLLGPTGISLSLPATALVADPQAGEREIRHRSVYMISFVAIVVGILAGVAAEMPDIIPISLLRAIAGLALLNIMIKTVQDIVKSPIIIGPVFSLAIALSGMTFLGFGRYFWALAIGTMVSLILENEGLRQLREKSYHNNGSDQKSG